MSELATGKQVVIYGGGVAGAVLAKNLAAMANVTLVDPLDYFEIPMAAPRNLVRPEFAEQAIMSFAQALPMVRHVQGKLLELNEENGLVLTNDGKQIQLHADVTVLATGSRFANPLMRATHGTAVERKTFYRRFQQRLAHAQTILIVGGGPIGVEVAGEISENYPGKTITLLESGHRLLRGSTEKAARHASAVLAGRGVKIITGERLTASSGPSDDVFAAAGKAKTDKGQLLQYDLLVWCTGGQPNTAYMQKHFSDVLNDAGRIKVTPHLRVVGKDTLFAVGDITDLDENKMAWHIASQVKNATANIRLVLAERMHSGDLKIHRPQTGNPSMAITLGSSTGVVQLPVIGLITAPWFNRKVKAAHMLVPKYRQIFGL